MSAAYLPFLPATDIGGAALVALDLANRAQANGQAVTIWVPGQGPISREIASRQLPVRLFDKDALFSGGWWRSSRERLRLLYQFRRTRPALAHVHDPLIYGALSRTLRWGGLATLAHVHIEESIDGLTWAFRVPPPLIVTCSRFLIEHVRRCLPHALRQSQWIEAVPNAVDVTRFYPAADRRAAKTHVGAPLDVPLILMLANLAPHKGQETTLRAVAALKERNRPVVCWLAGVEREGKTEYTATLERRIAELNLGDRVRLLGYRTDAPDLLRAADFFLLPSTHEGLPLTILEAQATRVPVLASSTAGIPEVIRAGETGFMIAPDRSDEYAACLDRLLNEPALALKIAEQAFQHTTKEYSWSNLCRRMDDLYAELLRRTYPGNAAIPRVSDS